MIEWAVPILSRYFLRLFLPVFALCLGIFAGVLLMNQFLKLFSMAVMKGISPLWIAACFARLLPFICSLAVPMAFLVALLLTLGQLSESGEITALRASGFSVFEMTWPFLAVAVGLSSLLLYLNHKASPDGFHSFKKQYAAAARQIARVDIEPRSFIRLGEWKLYARDADKESGRLDGVYLVRHKGKGQEFRVDAAHGHIVVEKGKGVALELYDGDMQMPNAEPEKYTSGSFKKYRLEVPLAGGPAEERNLDIQEMSTPRLKDRIAAAETSPQHKIEYTVEMAVRSASALSPLVFFFLGLPLGLQISKHSKGLGFALSIGVLFAFYGLLAVGIGLGRRHQALARVAPWLSNVAGLAAGAAMTRRLAKR
jgi:lipopolysaccharide export system permease protein